MKRVFLTYFAVLLLSACSGYEPVLDEMTDYRPDTEARVRLFGQNSKASVLTSAIDCAAGKKGENTIVGGSAGGFWQPLTGMRSHTLGITATEHSRQIRGRGLRNTFFRELEIPAGMPVNVQAPFTGVSARYVAEEIVTLGEGTCNSGKASFVPESGKDYEVIGLNRKKGCGVAVFEVDKKSGALTPVPVAGPVSCVR